MPRLLIPVESMPGETRVAATPDTVKKFVAFGCDVSVERGAGTASGYLDAAYADQGAELINPGDPAVWSQADILLCVQTPASASLSRLKRGALVVGLLSPYGNEALAASLKQCGLSAMALELLPRISRAQSADALSSQANIAGYKSVLLASAALDRYFPMLMTAAGTVPGQTVDRKGVKLLGGNDLPCTVPNHASALYGRNLVALLEPTLKGGVLTLDTEDELIAGCLIAQDGSLRRGDVLTPGAS